MCRQLHQKAEWSSFGRVRYLENFLANMLWSPLTSSEKHSAQRYQACKYFNDSRRLDQDRRPRHFSPNGTHQSFDLDKNGFNFAIYVSLDIEWHAVWSEKRYLGSWLHFVPLVRVPWSVRCGQYRCSVQ